MFCKNCGAQIPEDAGFCVSCGTAAEVPVQFAEPVPDTSNQETMVFTPIPEPVQPPVTEQTTTFQPYMPPEQTPVTPEEIPETTPDNSKGHIALIVSICVVLVAILGLLVALILPTLTGTTEEISGSSKRKHNSTTATADSESISSSNPYSDDFISADSYILADSDSRYYSRSELVSMTRQQLYLAQQELFARHGSAFDDGDLNEFFSAKNWYIPGSTPSVYDENRFTNTERVNLLLLRALLMERDGTTGSNPYTKFNSNTEGFILPYSDSRRITKNDVKDLNEKQLIVAYSEIYARKGYIFDDNDLQLYFSGKNWYTPSIVSTDFDATTMLNEVEQDNYSCLNSCLDKVKGVRFSSGNPYSEYYSPYSEFIFSDSDRRALTASVLDPLTDEQLILARNEIFARYGYAFYDQDLFEYFMNCSWYYPTVALGKHTQIHMSNIETNNVNLILEIEEKRDKAEQLEKLDTTLTQELTTSFYTLRMPTYWKDNCTYENINEQVFFYEKQNKQEGCGWLFSIEFAFIDSDLEQYRGDYQIYGYLTDTDGYEYYVLIGGPTDVNCVKEMELYIKMIGEKTRILNSIQWAEGCTFRPA